MRISAYYDRLNNKKIFGCEDCYDSKETLKALGFKWNPFRKEWQKEYKTPVEMTTILVDVMVDCDLDFEVYLDAFSKWYDEMKHTECEENFTKDSLEKFNKKYGEE